MALARERRHTHRHTPSHTVTHRLPDAQGAWHSLERPAAADATTAASATKPKGGDAPAVTAVDRSTVSGGLMASGDSYGRVRLARYPCKEREAPYHEWRGHSSSGGVAAIKFMPEDSHVISIGEHDACVFQWRHEEDDRVEEAAGKDDWDEVGGWVVALWVVAWWVVGGGVALWVVALWVALWVVVVCHMPHICLTYVSHMSHICLTWEAIIIDRFHGMSRCRDVGM